jgi:hypothetical protein
MGNSIRLPIDCDFSETGLDDMRVRLGAANMSDLTVFVTEYERLRARQLQGVYGFDLVIIPHEIARSSMAWCAAFGGSVCWSMGCP